MKQTTKDALDRYVQDHIPTGGFLRAVLANDLMQALGRADCENRRDIYEICSYIYNEIPSSCHGSYEKVDAWLTKEKE